MLNGNCDRLRQDIIKASKKRMVDPYKKPFQPKDLGLKASDYGSFSDHCKESATKSADWCGCGTLTCIEYDKSERPSRYILTREDDDANV